MFCGIMGYIWRLRFSHPWLWVPLVAWVLVSHLARRERAAALGFRLEDLGDCFRRFGPALLSLVVVLCGAGVLFDTFRPLKLEQAAGSWALYLPWGLFQQYMLNAYFLRRFETGLSQRSAGIVTAGLFSAVHSPNWFLMLVTPVASYAGIQVYRRNANLYFLGFAHATIGFLLFMVVPDAISHHLNVGPGWWLHR